MPECNPPLNLFPNTAECTYVASEVNMIDLVLANEGTSGDVYYDLQPQPDPLGKYCPSVKQKKVNVFLICCLSQDC